MLTSQHTTKVLTHKRAFSDEASKITTAFPRANPAVESLRGQTMTQSQSSLCINGSHVYDSEPSTPKGSGALSSKLVLLEKCSPLSRSLQNLTKRSEDKASFAEGRRWSFDKLKKEEKEEEKDAQASSTSIQEAQIGGCPVQAMTVSSAAESADKGKKLRKTFFSGGRSDSLPSKSELSHAGSTSEGRLRGWFGSSESQNKPRWVGLIYDLVSALQTLWWSRRNRGLCSVGCPGFSVHSSACSFENGIDLNHNFFHLTTMLCHHLMLYFPQTALLHCQFFYPECVSFCEWFWKRMWRISFHVDTSSPNRIAASAVGAWMAKCDSYFSLLDYFADVLCFFVLFYVTLSISLSWTSWSLKTDVKREYPSFVEEYQLVFWLSFLFLYQQCSPSGYLAHH